MRIITQIISLFIFTIITFSGSGGVYSQNIDSLLEEINSNTEPKKLISIYNALGNKLRYAYSDSAMNFYRASLKLSVAQGDKLSEAEANASIGTMWAIKNNYDSAIYYSKKSLQIREKLIDTSGIAKSLNSMGLIELRQDNLSSSKYFLLLALEKGKSISDSSLLSKIYNNLGLLHKRKHNFDSALYFYHESLMLKEQLNDIKGIGSTTNNIALIYEKISEFDLALKYLNQSLVIRKQNKNNYGEAIVLNNFGLVYESQGDFKKALEFYMRSLKVMEELNKTARIATLYNNIGSVYVKLKDYKSGFDYLNKGLEINSNLGNVRGQINCVLDIAHFFEDLNVYQNAIAEYKKALVLLNTIDDMALRSEIFEGLYNSYEKFNYYDSALFFYKKYVHLNDSIFNTYSRRNIEKLEIEFQTLKKEKENQDLIRQNQIKEEELKRLLLVGAILSLILASIIVIGFFSIKSKNKLEKTYKLVLEQRNSIQTQSFELKNAYRKLQELSGFKEELTSMIVHDLKNPLNIILNVATINNYPDREQVILQSGKQMLNLVMNILDVYKYEGKSFRLELKNQFINPIINKVKTDMSFVLSEKSVKIQNNIDYDFLVKLDSNAIERVIINLLTNAIKFSPQGSVILITTEAIKNNKFRLHIIDQGEGLPSDSLVHIFEKFEQHEIRKLGFSGSTGIGLTYCKIAIEAHGGKIGVNSELNKGADFYFELDYLETKESEMHEGEGNENYLLLSRDNRRLLYPYIMALQEKNIYEVTEIRNILKLISKENKELNKFCTLIEGSVLNCNQVMFDELLELALSKE